MYPITEKQFLREDYLLLKVKAPHLVNSKAGQYALIQHAERSEPMPISIMEIEGEEVSFLVKVVGRTTLELKEEASQLFYVAGPLGTPFPIKHYGRVVFFATGWGVSPILNVVVCLKKEKNTLELYYIAEDNFLPLEDRLKPVFDRVEISNQAKEVDADLVVSAGSNKLSKEVYTLNQGKHHLAMVNTHILDAAGLCLVCRVLVDGSLKLACSDGPWFPADKVDWDHLISREELFVDQERLALEEYKKLLKRKELRKTSAEV